MNLSYYYKCQVPQWDISDWHFHTESVADMKRRERARIETIIKSQAPIQVINLPKAAV